MTINDKKMSTNPDESLGSLEKEALKRKERLKALKRKAENSAAGLEDSESTAADDTTNKDQQK